MQLTKASDLNLRKLQFNKLKAESGKWKVFDSFPLSTINLMDW